MLNLNYNMFNPFKIFKKKEEFPVEENTIEIRDLPQEKFQSNFNPGIDKEDLILSKLETINAKLDNIDERLKRLEDMANS